MKWASLLVAAAISAAPAAAVCAVVEYTAPAGGLPAGHLGNARFDAVLPSGRIITPLGSSVVTGMNARGLTLSPDGRYAIVSSDDERQADAGGSVDARIASGSSLAVIDVETLRVVDRLAFPGECCVAGVAAVTDPRAPQRSLLFAGGSDAIHVVDLDAGGHVTPDAQDVIMLAGPLDPARGDIGQSSPVSLVAARDGRFVYAVDAAGDSVTAIDTVARAVSGTSRTVGFAPFGVALDGDRLLVTNAGLMPSVRAPDPPLVPAFSRPPADELRASSLSFVGLGPGGEFAADTGFAAPALAMDEPPDGTWIVGGAHPSAIAVTPDGSDAFVAMTGVDRIATVALTGRPRVAGGTELRLFDRAPYGTQPAALALSHDGMRLYAALAGLNAVAVLDARDPLRLHRLGLLPTGWLPSALALSDDDRTLYVLNAKGFGHDVDRTDRPATGTAPAAVWSTLQKIDLKTAALGAATYTTLKNTRDVRTVEPHYPSALRNVVVIIEENKTFDAMLGDLGYGPADSTDVRFGAAITPNLHALARRYAVAGNLFADAQESGPAHQFITAGTDANAGRGGPGDAGQNPQEYPRAGYIFNALARHQISFRDYGDLVRLTGYDEGAAADPVVDDPFWAGMDDRSAPTRGLGGRYTAGVPAPAVLAEHVDLNYPGWNLRIRDERRAREFVRDYAALVRAHQQPRYTHIWLPSDHTGAGPDIPPVAEEVADGDRALGTIVQYLSRLPAWRTTAIFVLADDAGGLSDHVAPDRTYAVVISPFAKQHYVGMRHLSTVSILKTAEQILDLPPLSLGDLLATDMSDFFTVQPDFRSFTALAVPVQTAAAPDFTNR